MYCQNCGKEVNDNAVVCVHCGCVVNREALNKSLEEDKTSVGLAILSFLIPLFGWIYGGVRYKEYPKSSKVYIECGLISFIIWLIFIMI